MPVMNEIIKTRGGRITKESLGYVIEKNAERIAQGRGPCMMVFKVKAPPKKSKKGKK